MSLDTKIRISGKDRISFLHHILTNDIQNLKPGQKCFAALLNATGKILMWMRVQMMSDHVLLFVENSMGAKTISLLDHFLITEDVQMEEWVESISKTGSAADEIDRIESGIPKFGIDMDETIILSETGLDELAVSETKGCYPGQEVIAKIKTYGRLNRKLCGFIFRSDVLPEKGNKVYSLDGKEIGWITSACFSPKLKRGIALGYLIRGYFENPVQVMIACGSESIAGKSLSRLDAGFVDLN